MRKLLAIVSFLILFSYFTSLQAHEHSSLKAHEHGKLTINVAIIDNALELELEGPAASITGFEYIPSSKKDKEIATFAKQQLDDPLALFALSTEAKCELTAKEIKSSIFGNGDNTDEHEKNHENKQVEDDQKEPLHSDVASRYRFNCKQPHAIKKLDFSNFFKVFPLTKQISLQYIGSSGQQGATLTETNSQLMLNP